MKQIFRTVVIIVTLGGISTWWWCMREHQPLPLQSVADQVSEPLTAPAPISIKKLSMKKRLNEYTLTILADTSTFTPNNKQMAGSTITCTLDDALATRAIIEAHDYTLDQEQKSIDFYNGVTTELFIK